MARKKKKASLLPTGISGALKAAGVVALGFVLTLLGLLGITALFSYYPLDTSLNTAGAGVFSNALGLVGASIADALWQGLGLAAVLIPIAMVLWGSWLTLRIHPSFVVARILTAILAILFFAVGFAGFDIAPSWPVIAGWGGVLGFVLFGVIFRFLDALDFGMSANLLRIALSFFMVLVSLWLMAFAFSIRWTAILHEVFNIILRVVQVGINLWYAVRNHFRAKENEPPVSAPKIKLTKVKTPEPKAATATALKASSAKSSRKSDKGFKLPRLDFLAPVPAGGQKFSKETLTQNAHRLEEAFREYGVDGEVVNILPGPVVTLYEFNPAFGVRSTRVISLADEIARSMCAKSVRIAVVPGRSVLGIELPNEKRETVFLRELLEDDKFQNSELTLPLALGKNIGGKAVFADLVKMPHLLVAGTTGSGKSVAVNTMILSLLYRFTPAECRMIMVDPKMLELSVYNDIPHLLTPVVTEPKKAVVALKWAVKEMEDRYRAMSLVAVRNIAKYNEKLAEIAASGKTPSRTVQVGFDENGQPLMQEQPLDLKPFSHIVVIVDEMADLMLVAGKEVEAAIQRLAQMARAAGIHLIMATQRPSVDVITGTIKANFPTRISFQVTSKIDSRTILNEQGAETLLGRGDMLYMEAGQKPVRVHGPFVSDAEVEDVVKFLKTQGEPEYLDAVVEDDDDGMDMGLSGGGADDAKGDIYAEAVEIVRSEQKVSISYLQRRLGIGYNRAADIVERMEREGIVSTASSSGKREVLIS